jgi:type III secretory pathway component EscR
MTPVAPSLVDAFSLVAIAFFIGLIPLAAVVVTSFLKITVVLGLLKNAIGVQQVPSNMVINGIAIIVSAYIMAPIGMDAVDSIQAKQQSASTPQKFMDTINAVKEPYRVFLKSSFFCAPHQRCGRRNVQRRSEKMICLFWLPHLRSLNCRRRFVLGFCYIWRL